MSTTEYAKQFVAARDKNGNGMLDGEELENLRGPEARSDANNDKVITVEEIVAGVSERNGSPGSQGNGERSARSAQKSASSAGSAAGNASRVFLGAVAVGGAAVDKNEASKRRTYRFTPATERLPTTGLPSWFKSRDKNKDGQVAMSEYSRTWSERLVNEFGRYDLNKDGVVTAKEAVK
jgi:hypothetical protein